MDVAPDGLSLQSLLSQAQASLRVQSDDFFARDSGLESGATGLGAMPPPCRGFFHKAFPLLGTKTR